MMPRVIQVIESEELRGAGTRDAPYRRVRQYHTLNGDLLAEADPVPVRSSPEPEEPQR